MNTVAILLSAFVLSFVALLVSPAIDLQVRRFGRRPARSATRAAQ